MHRKKLAGPTESNLVLHTWDFQPRDRASQVFLNFPLSKAINATGYLEPAWIIWWSPEVLSVQIHSPTIILLFRWCFCLHQSFLLEDPCCMLATISADTSFCSLTCLRHHIWTQGPGLKFSPSHRNWVLPACWVLKKLRAIQREVRHGTEPYI